MTTAAQPREILEKVDLWLRMYRSMVSIRLFEQQVNELYTRALMPGLAHLYIGEEAVAVGVCEALQRTDYITSTHRGHGHCLAKGASPNRMFAELLGKEAGYCKGKGGSMHIADPATGNLGANAIVCGSAGIATGAAFSAKRLGTGQVSVCFFGEGALGQGLLYEVMNLAQLFKLPVIYVCENNQYNEYTHYRETTAGEVTGRAKAFGIQVESMDGQDSANKSILERLKQTLDYSRETENISTELERETKTLIAGLDALSEHSRKVLQNIEVTKAQNEEEKKTEGRFVQIHYKVTNKGKKEEMLLDRPKVVDDKGREFGPIDMESFYVPAKAKTIGLDTLQPSMPKEYWTVIEVPADAKSLKFQVHGFSLLLDPVRSVCFRVRVTWTFCLTEGHVARYAHKRE